MHKIQTRLLKIAFLTIVIVMYILISLSHSRLKTTFGASFLQKAPTLATNAGVIWNNWVFSMYGGVGMDGVYQETDFILVYQKDWLNIRMEYYYNFTEGITDIPIPSGLFDFDKSTTRGLLDFIFDLSLDKNRQWELTSSTLIFRERYQNGKSKL